MPKTTKAMAIVNAIVPEVLSEKDLSSLRIESDPNSPIIKYAMGLQVTDADSLAEADGLLASITEKQKVVDAKLMPGIRSLKASVEWAKSIMDELRTPWDNAEKRLRLVMGQYRLAERLQIQQADAARLREEDRIRQEAERVERMKEAAKTPQMRGKLESRLSSLEVLAVKTASQPVAEPVKVLNSSTRFVPVYRVVDVAALIKGVKAGDVPDEALTFNPHTLAAQLKADPDVLRTWPGMVVEEQAQVVRR